MKSTNVIFTWFACFGDVADDDVYVLRPGKRGKKRKKVLAGSYTLRYVKGEGGVELRFYSTVVSFIIYYCCFVF